MRQGKKLARVPIPAATQTAVLTASGHRCVVCGSRSIQIHHINGNRADNRVANLVVLCLEHHDQAERTGGLTKKITQAQLRVYKRGWEGKIRDGIAPPLEADRSLTVEESSDPAPSLIDEIYGSRALRIFISSKMRRRPLYSERLAAAEAVESLPGHRAWIWERDANAGPYSSELVCVRHARTSQGLILLLARDLTELTEKEYVAARDNGVPRYIFLKAGARPKAAVRDFVKAERATAVYQRFGNTNELKSLILGSIVEFERQSVMREIGRRRASGTSLSI